MRLSFQAFSDTLPSFAFDCAQAIGGHRSAEDVERVRRMCLAELGTKGDAKELKMAIKELRNEDLENLGKNFIGRNELC